MKKKALLALASMGLLVIVLVYGTIAWYTNIANVTGLTFDVANFDFTVNYAADNFIIQIDDYLNVKDSKAAPGTGGVIPIKVSATGDVGATYAINLDFSDMAPEFMERIRFFYYTYDSNTGYTEHVLDENAEDIDGTITAAGSVTEYIYWEWMYTADITPILVSPYVDDGSLAWTDFDTMDDMTFAEIERAVTNWNTFLNTENTYKSAVTTKYTQLEGLGHTKVMDPKAGSTTDTNFATLVESVLDEDAPLEGRALKEEIERLYSDEHDAFDTALALGAYDESFTSKVSKRTYDKGTTTVMVGDTKTTYEILAYQRAMQVELLVSGAQAMPLKDDGNTTWTSTGTTAYKAE